MLSYFQNFWCIIVSEANDDTNSIDVSSADTQEDISKYLYTVQHTVA